MVWPEGRHSRSAAAGWGQFYMQHTWTIVMFFFNGKVLSFVPNSSCVWRSASKVGGPKAGEGGGPCSAQAYCSDCLSTTHVKEVDGVQQPARLCNPYLAKVGFITLKPMDGIANGFHQADDGI
ncbi:hypothetical protein HaLaN_24027 [Haematococcus lacustris]|uniref:Uncharacterized protein n=1 Tax=Haematococcus lacustris TaxID=44745 RepID=A0A6A0A2W2_HAELA|nr:hypothetical protein HaLaN_24027 [Haematococcus lacustris]